MVSGNVLPTSPNWPEYSQFVSDLETDPSTTIIKDAQTLVMLASHPNQGEVIVRLPGKEQYENDPDLSRSYHEVFSERFIGLRRAIGARSLEQLIAYSIPEQAIVTELAPGKTVNTLTAAEVDAITPEHFVDLLKTAHHMHEIGVTADTGTSANYLFDIESGFTIIDYSDRAAANLSFETDPIKEYVDILRALGDEASVNGDVELEMAWHTAERRGHDVLLEFYPDAASHRRLGPAARQWLCSLNATGEGRSHDTEEELNDAYGPGNSQLR